LTEYNTHYLYNGEKKQKQTKNTLDRQYKGEQYDITWTNAKESN